MSARFSLLRERVRQARSVRDVGSGVDRMPSGCAEGRMNCSFTPGDRVFDRETGEEGIVVAGTTETVLIPTPERADG